MNHLIKNRLAISFSIFSLFSCTEVVELIPKEEIPESLIPGIDIVQLPVVIHIIHNGEVIGDGPNLSTERILRQIEILNEDFRRKKGTRGFNEHPDGADSKIEFVLAKIDPDSISSNGINRIDASVVEIENLGYNQNHYAQYDYWNSSNYINVWVTPLPPASACLALGLASGPFTDLPGAELLSIPQENDAEGILINWQHFGESEVNCQAKYGRTLTHEMGHYLGLLHTWGKKDCEFNDYCDDTPAVDRPVYGNTAFTGCDGQQIMVGNYMNYSDDEIMNIFTKDQTERMHYVLRKNKERNSLIKSRALLQQ